MSPTIFSIQKKLIVILTRNRKMCHMVKRKQLKGLNLEINEMLGVNKDFKIAMASEENVVVIN